MDRIINLQILGRPINVAIIVLVIVLIWLGFFTIAKGPAFAKLDPDNNGNS